MAPRYQKRIIHIAAEDTPNVRYALAEERAGIKPTNRTFVRGIVSWRKYCKRRKDWDPILQCIGLDGRFYKGAEILMYPPQWLNHSERLADILKGRQRIAKGLGCDPGEGKANSAWSVVDDFGLIEQIGFVTENTANIAGQTLALMRKYNLRGDQVCFDAGGGGRQHAHYLRAQGHNVRIVGFGEKLGLTPRSGMQSVDDRKAVREDRQVYQDRRAEMYDRLRDFINPDYERTAEIKGKLVKVSGFGISRDYTRLRHQLALIPLTRDGEGILYLLPKDKPRRDGRENPLELNKRTDTLVGLIGYSPDEADSLVLALHAMCDKQRKVVVGATQRV